LVKAGSSGRSEITDLNPEEIVMNPSVKSESRSFLPFAAAMLFACALVTPSAFAGDEPRSETVKFQDLNVDSPAGVEALYNRIHAAARRVCAQSDPVAVAGVGSCIRKAEGKAIQDLNLPGLTAYYRMKTGGKADTLTASR
jgi:UrcA family protein